MRKVRDPFFSLPRILFREFDVIWGEDLPQNLPPYDKRTPHPGPLPVEGRGRRLRKPHQGFFSRKNCCPATGSNVTLKRPLTICARFVTPTQAIVPPKLVVDSTEKPA